jgi:hypothetical protein
MIILAIVPTWRRTQIIINAQGTVKAEVVMLGYVIIIMMGHGGIGITVRTHVM